MWAGLVPPVSQRCLWRPGSAGGWRACRTATPQQRHLTTWASSVACLVCAGHVYDSQAQPLEVKFMPALWQPYSRGQAYTQRQVRGRAGRGRAAQRGASGQRRQSCCRPGTIAMHRAAPPCRRRHLQARELVDYAWHRGVRILPKFDMPGGCGGWLPACPCGSGGAAALSTIRAAPTSRLPNLRVPPQVTPPSLPRPTKRWCPASTLCPGTARAGTSAPGGEGRAACAPPRPALLPSACTTPAATAALPALQQPAARGAAEARVCGRGAEPADRVADPLQRIVPRLHWCRWCAAAAAGLPPLLLSRLLPLGMGARVARWHALKPRTARCGGLWILPLQK